MNRRVSHQFLVWLFPALFAGIGTFVGLVIAAAQVWPEVKSWAALRWQNVEMILEHPLFYGALFLAVAAYIAALVYTTQEPSLPRQKAFRQVYLEGLTVAAKQLEESGKFGPDERIHPLAPPASREGEEQRRKIISDGRDLAHRYTVDPGDGSFRAFLERQRSFADIRPHLSQNYVKKLHASRTVYVTAGGAGYEPLVRWFLDEMDRLEKKWGLS